MDFILGIINCDYDREEVQEVFSLQGKRSFHHYEIQKGAIFSTCPAVDGEIILGIEKCQYQRIRFSPSALEIENDDYGLRPLFLFKDKEKFIFSSEIEPLLALLKREVLLNKEAIQTYLKTGVSLETFIAGVRNFSACEIMSLREGEMVSTFREATPYSFNGDIYREIVNLLKDSQQRWIKKYSIQAANLTGGADTRLLLALLDERERKSFDFYTDRSPYLSEEEDKDVIVAKELAKKYGLNHIVREHIPQEITDDRVFLRSDPAEILKLSGNHGGEILGGDVFGAMEFCKELWKESFQDNFSFLISLMFRSFFSDIYAGGVFNHWTMPTRFSARKCAPFWDQRLISLLGQLRAEHVQYYWSYAEVYRKNFPDFIETPFMSPIALHHHDFPFMEKGTNQKEVAKKKNLDALLEEERDLIREVGFFDYENLKEQEKVFISRALKVNRWINFFIRERKFL